MRKLTFWINEGDHLSSISQSNDNKIEETYRSLIRDQSFEF